MTISLFLLAKLTAISEMISTPFHFYKTPNLLKLISKDLVWNISTNNKEIYLTFDDGPIPKLTEYVLDTLNEFEAKASFFCVGENIYKYPDICQKIVEKGHILGNHTYNHLKGWSSKNEHYFENVEKCNNYISNYQEAVQKSLFRPPHGQITINQINHLKDKYKIIMWDILAYDFNTNHSPQKSLTKIIQQTQPGSIVVFHDNYKAEEKMKYMLPGYIKHFKERGFTFKKIEAI